MELERIRRLQKEVDRFLISFTPDDPEYVLVLLFYYRFLHTYSQKTKESLKEQLSGVDAVVDLLPRKRIEECALSFDFDTYIDSFLKLYEDWKILLVPDTKIVDSAVHLLVLDSGFAEVCTFVGEDVISQEQYCAQAEKRYRLQDHPIWSCMHEEFGHRYRENYDVGDEVMWL